MSKRDKLIKKLKSKPKDFTFGEVESLLYSFGAKKSNKGKTSGSKVRFTIGDTEIDLHKPHPQKELKPYQINEIINHLKKEGLI